MITTTEQHDSMTFKQCLSDHFDCYGIRLSVSLEKRFLKQYFRKDCSFELACALKYGRCVFLGVPNEENSVESVVLVEHDYDSLQKFVPEGK